jgi:subtilisin family serine protease
MDQRMLRYSLAVVLVFFSMLVAAKETPDPARDILVTFDNTSATSTSAGMGAPYLHRKRYSIAQKVRRDAAAIQKEYALEEIERWPIGSLSVYCFVYRVPEGADRKSILVSLNADVRVDSAQALQQFETSVTNADSYNDTYANLQYGLDVLDIAAAHQTTQGAGVRVAIIDSNIDKNHEDLVGRVVRVQEFLAKGQADDRIHGTAVASVIGARSNNALGMVGIAPEAILELYVSCWSGGEDKPALCDTFSLLKAMDAVLGDPPHVLNLSLRGPYDPLLERLIEKAVDAGVVVVAAGLPGTNPDDGFPSSMQRVLGVGVTPPQGSLTEHPSDAIFAPGSRIIVALPAGNYDFRSGSSLAAAHVSGVVALLLSIQPESSLDTISSILRQSQDDDVRSIVSINACDALNLAGSAQRCGD